MGLCGGDPPPKTPGDDADEKKFDEYLDENKSSFKNGPIANRSYTDWPCCFLFLAAIVGFCAASAYGW